MLPDERPERVIGGTAAGRVATTGHVAAAGRTAAGHAAAGHAAARGERFHA